MKKWMLLFLLFPLFGYPQESSFSSLSGSYLGQTPPGKKAVLFADGLVSISDAPEMCAAISMNGKEFFFNTIYKNSFSIFTTKEIDGKWTEPEPLSFSNDYIDRDFTISPDGNTIYFGSNRPKEGEQGKQRSLDIFFIERENQNSLWSEPMNMGDPINTVGGENYPCVTENGNLYFFSCGRDDSWGGCDLYKAVNVDGRFLEPLVLGNAINSEKHDWDAYVAPDESYIIFSSLKREDTHGTMDLYISYRNADGDWTKAKNMGLAVNSAFDEICPSVTPDGKYMFFTSRRRGMADVYWVDAKIIEDLKPNLLP